VTPSSSPVDRITRTAHESVVVEQYAAAGGRIASVTLDRPPVNALNAAAYDELDDVLDDLVTAPVDVVILTGGGTRAFAAGADLDEFLAAETPAEVEAIAEAAHAVYDRLEALDVPVIAAVNGPALGGGNELQLATHYTVVDSTATLGQPEINLKIIPGYGGTQRLPRIAAASNGESGYRQAVYALTNGRDLSPTAALEMGIADEVATEDTCRSRAFDIAHEYLTSEESRLQAAYDRRQANLEDWQSPASYPDLAADPEFQRILNQSEYADRTHVVEALLSVVEYGFDEGIEAGKARERERFGDVVTDDDAGRDGIQAFKDGESAPLPLKPQDPPLLADEETKAELVERGTVHPRNGPFYPGATPIPEYQFAWALAGDPATGEPDHGEPLADDGEREVVIPVEEPEPTEALLYMLTSEVNYNDVWAITGTPVSTYRTHDRDWHVTGSGGLALVVDLGEGLKEEGRVAEGDLVSVYAGQFDALSPRAGRDPMFADFEIQGYQTPDGSHQQFMVAQGTQLFDPPANLDLASAGSYILTMGTIYRALFTTLDVEAGAELFVEGASTGTGRDAVVMAAANGLDVTGMVSSDERAERAREAGAAATVDRTSEGIADAMGMVPNDPDAWDEWVAAGDPLLDAYRENTGGDLADYAISHAGQAAFSRTYQLLDEGGRLAFYGASTGHELAFIGKGDSRPPGEMFDRTDLRPGQAVMVWYGTPEGIEGQEDEIGEAAIRAALDRQARVAVVTDTDAQADYVAAEYDVEGTVSLETLASENDRFEWVPAMPALPGPDDPDALSAAIDDYMNKMFKPVGIAVGQHLETPTNPRGNPHVIFERAGQNTLGTSTMICASFQGEVVYAEAMAGERYSFYAPQVWMRQRRVYMPTTEIFGTHMKNTYEVLSLNEDIERGIYDVPRTHVTDWADAPQAHQDMWENVHEEGSYVINHALPDGDLETRADLFEAWQSDD
jgi:acrylyl-CoA reductase (NADPH)/3-hydroxypropionyl-CoA dehydratase/3-hydroxypropionyl-CoA synthetase